MTNYLRPDEQATESEIRKAQGRTKEFRSGLQNIASAGTAIAGKAALSKILPFLSPYIPEDMSFKGISKVMPAVGKFLKQGMTQGLSLKSGLDFLKNEISQSQQQQQQTQQAQPAQQNRNIIEQYSPELHEFIKGELAKGRPHLEAGALAQNNDKFKKIIKKIEGDHKTNFSAILDTIYGGGQYGGAVNPQQQSQQQAKQTGQGQQALMSILQKIQQQRGG